jgi:pimeloyl-ACP methyl ester carboxylesterase
VIHRLRHGKIELALHELRDGEGRALLCLHGLGQRSPHKVPPELEAWPGPVLGLDFSGHGSSGLPVGGGYTAELLMGDADLALAHLGEATLLGRGLGAYVALLLAGARPREVRGAVLCDGRGLAGGGPEPGSAALRLPVGEGPGPPDPLALAELSRDVRPPDYALGYLHQALRLSGLAHPVCVCARERPAWLRAVAAEPGVGETTLDAALRLYSA